MAQLFSSREGRLCINGKRVKRSSGVIQTPDTFGVDGDLSIPASEENILALCQLFIDTFIIPMGLRLEKGESPEGYPGLDIVKKYGEKEDLLSDTPNFLNRFKRLFRSQKNLTRGWCYLASGTLHRFLYKDFDLYRGECSIDGGDHHWWLQSADDRVIDLTEEQYRIFKIYDPRNEGKKMSPMGQSYAVKTRNMSVVVANQFVENELFMCDFPASRAYVQKK